MMIGVTLSACGGQKNIPTTNPSFSSEITASATSSITSTPIRPTESFPTPTFTPFPPYPTKKVLFEYYTVGYLSYFDSFYTERHSTDPKLILYDDGQMIVEGKQRVLSANEIGRFLEKIKALGFFSLESNQAYDQEDKLYDFGNQYEKVYDGLRYCILVNADKPRKLCAYEPYMRFLIPEMKRILQYLDEYKPTGLTPYYPDRILLSIQSADLNSDDLPTIATPWDSRFPPLDFPPPRTYAYETPPSILYIEGDLAKEIYIFMKSLQSQGVVIQDGKKYIVQVDVILPHETVINAYQ